MFWEDTVGISIVSALAAAVIVFRAAWRNISPDSKNPHPLDKRVLRSSGCMKILFVASVFLMTLGLCYSSIIGDIAVLLAHGMSAIEDSLAPIPPGAAFLTMFLVFMAWMLVLAPWNVPCPHIDRRMGVIAKWDEAMWQFRGEAVGPSRRSLRLYITFFDLVFFALAHKAASDIWSFENRSFALAPSFPTAVLGTVCVAITIASATLILLFPWATRLAGTQRGAGKGLFSAHFGALGDLRWGEDVLVPLLLPILLVRVITASLYPPPPHIQAEPLLQSFAMSKTISTALFTAISLLLYRRAAQKS